MENNTLSSITGEVPTSEKSKPVQSSVSISEDMANELFKQLVGTPDGDAAQQEPKVNIVTELSDDSLREMGFTQVTSDDVKKEAEQQVEQFRRDQFNSDLSLIDKAVTSEDELLDELEKTKDVSAYMATAKTAAGNKKSSEEAEETVTVDSSSTDSKVDEPEEAHQTNINDDDFVPQFYEDDETDTAKEDSISENDTDEPESYETMDDVEKILAKARTVSYDKSEDAIRPVSVKRTRKTKAEIESTNRFDSKTLGDQAFINSANRFKARNFRTVQAPLVNSGFMVDLVGTGANDLVMLYDNTDRNINASEYEVRRMRSILNSVVRTEPKVDPFRLRNLIHARDYPMLAYGHLCATLDEIIFPYTCEKCNKSFKIKVNPIDLLLNAEEINRKIADIENAKKIDDVSLLSKQVKYSFPSGFEVICSHPTFYDEVNILNSLNSYIQSLPRTDSVPLARMANSLLYIKSIILPNGVKAANIYQTFLALRMMDIDEYNQVMDTVEELGKQIIEPKFGIKNVECPNCHQKVDTITIDGIDQMVFFHIMVVRAEKEALKKKVESGKND